ncbi:hypothetical protein MP638_003670, partial [Amoeboaphelidium occidentale]
MIALNLHFDDLVHFQKSNRKVSALTSDASFYSEYYRRHYPRQAIRKMYDNRDRTPNWTNVLESLFKDPVEFAHYFYGYPKGNFLKYGIIWTFLLDYGLKDLGIRLAILFRETIDNLADYSGQPKIQSAHSSILKLRQKTPELARTAQWHAFEDVYYCDFSKTLERYYHDHNDLNSLEPWLEILDFAKKNKYTSFQQKVIKCLVTSIFRKTAKGHIDCDQGIEYLSTFIPQLRAVEIIRYPKVGINFSKMENLRSIARLNQFLFEEIVGKKRYNYMLFYNNIVSDLIDLLSHFVHVNEFVLEHLNILRHVLAWRHYVPNEDWRSRSNPRLLMILAIVDETLRDIIFVKGFKMDNSILKELRTLLNQ